MLFQAYVRLHFSYESSQVVLKINAKKTKSEFFVKNQVAIKNLPSSLHNLGDDYESFSSYLDHSKIRGGQDPPLTSRADSVHLYTEGKLDPSYAKPSLYYAKLFSIPKFIF